MKVNLETWGRLNMKPAPTLNTLRRYARSNRFDPPAEFVGRSWWVKQDAELLPEPEKKEYGELSNDSVVNDLLNGR